MCAHYTTGPSLAYEGDADKIARHIRRASSNSGIKLATRNAGLSVIDLPRPRRYYISSLD
jgi:hypothetical protein